MLAADPGDNWRDFLEWEGRMGEMMEGQFGEDEITDAKCNVILLQFQKAHLKGFASTGSQHHKLSSIRLSKQRVALLGKMQRFRDQGEAMCGVASSLCSTGKHQEAAEYYHKARKVGEAHGFFSVECEACLGLGNQAIREGHDEEGIELLRNALAALPLVEHDLGIMLEIKILTSLIDPLFKATDTVDQLEPLILRLREVTKAKSASEERVCLSEFSSLIYTARLHEVRAS
jgi:hypothetical protein